MISSLRAGFLVFRAALRRASTSLAVTQFFTLSMKLSTKYKLVLCLSHLKTLAKEGRGLQNFLHYIYFVESRRLMKELMTTSQNMMKVVIAG